jgi:tetratricopeptide (TPR) repeat protein
MDKFKFTENSTFKIVLIALLALFIYANTSKHEYTWDDQLVIHQNEATVQGLDGLGTIWTSYAYLKDRKIYRPIPQSFQAILWEIAPNQPFLPHLLNILLYSLCCVSFYLLLRKYFPFVQDWLLFLVLVLFSLHPVHSEVVANCKSLDEILSLLFTLWALSCLKGMQLKNYLFATFFFILALLSKISAITILPVFAVIIALQNLAWFKNKWIKIKNFVDPCLLISVLFIFLFAINYFLKYNNTFGIYLLFASAPFLLFVRDNYLKSFLVVILSVLISIEDRWAFAAMMFLIYFSMRLNTLKEDRNFLLAEIAIFILITVIFDQYYLPNALFILLSTLLFYFNLLGNIWIKKYLKPVAIAYFVITFFGFILGNGYNILAAYYVLTLSLLALNKVPSKLKKISLLILLIPLLEFQQFDFLYDNILNQEKIVVEEIEKTTFSNTKLYPYNNILFASSSPSERNASIARIQLVYLKKLMLASPLVHQHGTWQIQLATWKDWDVYLSIFIHIFLLWLAYYFYRQRFYITMWGILWYFLTISIYTNIVVLLPDTLAERFLFLPSIGFSVALVSGLYYILQKFLKEEKRSFLALSMLLFPLFCFYAFKTINRNKDWKNNYTLAVNTLPYAQNNASINAQYALELNNLIKSGQIQNKDSAEALVVQHYKKAIEIYPDFYGPQADLASYYILQAQPDSAFNYLVKATELNPDDWIYRYYLGLIYYERKKYELAITEFKAIQNNETLQSRAFEFPELLEAYEFGARCLHNIGRDPEAYTMLEEGIAIFENKSTYILLANLYRTTGHGKEAVDVYKRLLVYSPNDQELINTILYLEQGLIY